MIIQSNELVNDTHPIHSVVVTDMAMGGVSLGVSQTTYNTPFCIVDSGTTLLLLPTAAYNAISTYLNGTSFLLPDD